MVDRHPLLRQRRQQPRALRHREARRDADHDEIGHFGIGEQALQLAHAAAPALEPLDGAVHLGGGVDAPE